MKEIRIAGGGLAGLTLGIGLRQQGVPVTIWEAGHYPRHRVCGEFISGNGQSTLELLGLKDKLLAAGGCLARSVGFYSPRQILPPQELPQAAICLSRFVIDALLAAEFRRLGGKLIERQRWSRPLSEGELRATGRRRQTKITHWRWFGLKAHASNAPLTSDLELYCLPDGYIGLCRIEHGRVNVCGLFRTPNPVSDLAKTWPERLRGPAGSFLRHRLEYARFHPDSFASVAGLEIASHPPLGNGECTLGDAFAMIAPVTGNGMSMAFESAGLAIAPLTQFSQGHLSWAEARQEITLGCQLRFSRRLRSGSCLQAALLNPTARELLLILGRIVPNLWPILFGRTR